VISTSNSVPLVGGDRKAFGVWASAFSVPGARCDVGVLRFRSVVRHSGSFVGQVGGSWKVERQANSAVYWKKEDRGKSNPLSVFSEGHQSH
jgi:hypothetical protein